MDKPLAEGLAALGVSLPSGAEASLLAYARELLKWNAKVNLTAITAPAEVAEKHLVDSLAVLPEVGAARSLLDLGAGAGLPGIPLSLALPELQATLVDTVAKKVGFMKQAVAILGLGGRVRAIHARAEGNPEKESLPRVEVVISRALMDVGAWVKLAQAYALPGGRVVAMMGQAPSDEVLGGLGLKLLSVRRYQLPLSKDPRAVAVFHVEHPTSG